MASEKGCRKDKNQNIQVFVRLRPLNQRERDIKSLGVIEVINNREVVVRQSQQTSLTKKFTFDRAFGPDIKQVEVYQAVVSPLIEEVLAGYNCTVFAYGQTGTGKTHTMVGENTGDECAWQNDPLAGIIPRALSQLFDELRISNTEYTVRVSYLELYNEELFDLLSSSEDNSKLRIYEDVTRKGSNIVNGLEEITVYNKNEVYKIMAQGQERKRVASTLMNAQSSRSHTVFTIVVHMKENSSEGEELVKIGKLNLVDLAGSENISKAGSDIPGKRERARECVNINQSLLTLGRVITALVERHPHIPYRESKLTRILQESLGGRTKTSIIATISPGHKDLEETMSTLEYAHRAKNIQNKPEVNQKMTKKAILKEFAEEIDKLKRDLQAARDKTGVYLANETFAEMTLKDEEQRKEIQALLLKKRAMEEERDKMEGVFKEINTALEKRNSELNDTKNKLATTKHKLIATANLLNSVRAECSEQKHLVSRHVHTENTLTQQATEILQVADTAAQHVALLHDTVDRRRKVESTNLEVTRTYREQAAEHRQLIVDQSRHLATFVADTLQHLHTQLENVNASNADTVKKGIIQFECLTQMLAESLNEMLSLSNNTASSLQTCLSTHHSSLTSRLQSRSTQLSTVVNALITAVKQNMEGLEKQDVTGVVNKFVTQWYEGATARMASLEATSSSMCERVRSSARGRRQLALHIASERKDAVQRRKQYLATANAEMKAKAASIERRLSLLSQEIERERTETKERLEQWAQAEMQWANQHVQRVNQHVQQELDVLEQRLSKQLTFIDNQRAYLVELMDPVIQLGETMSTDNDQELVKADENMNILDTGVNHDIEIIDKYESEFGEGANAVKCDMEAATHSVVDLVDHCYSLLLENTRTFTDNVQRELNEVTISEETSSKEVTTESERMNGQLLNEHKQLTQQICDKWQANNKTTTDKLSTVSSSLSTLSTASASYCNTHSAGMQTATNAVCSFDTDMRSIVERLQDLEEKCLNEQYKVYSPTGNTPRRTEYRFPRSLAVTSPHHAILARYRAQNNYTNDDCIVIESEDESHNTTDCDSSSISEDSSPFLAPATPTTTTPRHNNSTHNNSTHNNTHNTHNGNYNIVKSTSESDIYTMKHSQDMGKENVHQSLKKKPSKLPGPASIKKPFNERNGALN